MSFVSKPRLVLGAVILGCAVLAAGSGCGPEPQHPNVLFITIDTLRADHLGTYGYTRPTSPSIDAFAQEACVFEAAHSSASWTLPSIASIMTSLLSTTHGCWKIQSKLEPEFTTLAEVLRNGGYDTAMVVPHLFLSAQYGLQQGFTHVDDTLIRTVSDSAEAISSPGITDKGLAWIDEKAAVADGVPWFLWLHYLDPHDTYLPHAGYSEKFGQTEQIDLYDGEIAFTDDYVGRVLARLKEKGLAPNTIVVIMSDHGEEFGEHGEMRHGKTLYEAAVRIPLLVRAPGVAPRRIVDVVSNVDVMPTLLELCGIAWQRGGGTTCNHALEGRTLRPLMSGGADLPHEAVSEVRWHATQDVRSVRTQRWKYIEHRLGTDSRDLLFDLDHDPGETADVAAVDAQLTSGLRDALGRRIVRAMNWARCYPLPQQYQPLAGDNERLRTLGYVGDDAAEGAAKHPSSTTPSK